MVSCRYGASAVMQHEAHKNSVYATRYLRRFARNIVAQLLAMVGLLATRAHRLSCSDFRMVGNVGYSYVGSTNAELRQGRERRYIWVFRYFAYGIVGVSSP